MNNLVLHKAIFFLLMILSGILFNKGLDKFFHVPAVTRSLVYYIDSNQGDDMNNGNSEHFPWRSLVNLKKIKFNPGDVIRFKRGTHYIGPLYITDSGAEDKYIILTDYGDSEETPPMFTNTDFSQDNFGNCIRIQGNYVIVENLYFYGTSAHMPGDYQTDGWDVWEMGAIYVDKGAEHCIVRMNEIVDCLVGIKSYGKHTLIEDNFIHDCNRVLKEWNWGPIGIWLGADYQEVRYNRIFNYRAEDPRIRWSGADGGAIEIDDARFDKLNISIHHNYSRDCQGFLEVTWSDVRKNPRYENFRIHHNISDDYQWFIALWSGVNCQIENNTIIRRKINTNEKGVFNITITDARNKIRNNIIVTEKDVVIFNTGRNVDKKPNNLIQNNLYFAAKGSIQMGKEGPGGSAVFGDPCFINYKSGHTPEDFFLLGKSPAIDKGMDLGYDLDFRDSAIPYGLKPDIGAFEYRSKKYKQVRTYERK